MEQRYHLQALANADLLAALSRIVRRGNEITAELLVHLAELDERQLFLELGFPSLFAYCTEALGLCEATAGRRVAAVRVCRQYPKAFARVASGKLHVSALCLLKQHLNAENATELFEACSWKGSRQIEQLLAARFPRPDVRERFQRLPSKVTLNVECASEVTPASVSVGPGQEPTAVVVRNSQPPGTPRPSPPTRLEPLCTDRYGVHFTADGEFRELLERVRGLASHRLPNGELMTLLKRGLEAYERELEKERFAVGRKPRAAQSGSANPNPEPNPDPKQTAAKGRCAISAAVTRAVYLRDEKRCTFVANDGRRCGAQRFLELDHIEPWRLAAKTRSTICGFVAAPITNTTQSSASEVLTSSRPSFVQGGGKRAGRRLATWVTREQTVQSSQMGDGARPGRPPP
jgi:hypothetical protein